MSEIVFFNLVESPRFVSSYNYFQQSFQSSPQMHTYGDELYFLKLFSKKPHNENSQAYKKVEKIICSPASTHPLDLVIRLLYFFYLSPFFLFHWNI